MPYDAFTAIELATQCYLRGVERIDTYAIIESFGFHKYHKRRAKHARQMFIDRAMRSYDRQIEIDPKSFGRLKGHVENNYVPLLT